MWMGQVKIKHYFKPRISVQGMKIMLTWPIHICSFSFVAAGSLACRPSVQIYPIILTIVIFVTVISILHEKL